MSGVEMVGFEDLKIGQEKSIFYWFFQIFWVAVVALTGITTSIYSNSFGWIGIAFAWMSAGLIILFANNLRIWLINRKLKADDEERARVRDIFLKQLIQSKTIYGNDILIGSEGKNKVTVLLDISNIEILAFSQKKFDFILFTKDNYQKFIALDEKYNDLVLGEEALEKLGIEYIMTSDYNTFFKCFTKVEPHKEYVFYFGRPQKSDKKDFEINFTISRATPVPAPDNNEKKQEEMSQEKFKRP